MTVVDSSMTGSIWRARAVVGTATPVLIMSGNYGRIHGSIFNHTNSSLFVGFDHPAVSVNSFDVKIPSGTLYELPRPIFRGRVWVIADADNSVAMIQDVSGSIG